MDCADQLSIRLRSSDGQPRPGIVIELDIDGTTVTCAVPDSGEPRQCDDQTVTVTHQEIQRCRAAGCRGTGKFEEAVEIAATPGRVRVRVKQDQRLLSHRPFVVHYARVLPNGPGCSPVCRQARILWQYR